MPRKRPPHAAPQAKNGAPFKAPSNALQALSPPSNAAPQATAKTPQTRGKGPQKGHAKMTPKPVKMAVEVPAKMTGGKRVFQSTRGHKITSKLTDQEAYEICRRIPLDEEDYEFADKLCQEFNRAGYLLVNQIPYFHMMALQQLEREGVTKKGRVEAPKKMTPQQWKKKLAKRDPKPKPERKDALAARGAPPKMWYVLAVEPHSDWRTRKEIIRKKLIEGLERYIGQVFCPFQIVERIVDEDKGQKKRILVRELKFPGYLICNLRYNETVHHLCVGARGAMGFLPYRIDDEDYDGWSPTALPDQQACELLIKNQEEAKKKRTEKQKASVPYKVGDTVKITDGPFAGVVGEVLGIGGPEKEPVAKVQMTMFGRSVPVEVKWFQAKRK